MGVGKYQWIDLRHSDCNEMLRFQLVMTVWAVEAMRRRDTACNTTPVKENMKS